MDTCVNESRMCRSQEANVQLSSGAEPLSSGRTNNVLDSEKHTEQNVRALREGRNVVSSLDKEREQSTLKFSDV